MTEVVLHSRIDTPGSPLVRTHNDFSKIHQAHREVYASFRSDELQAWVDKTFKERPPLVPELAPDLLKKRE